jgi:hypothetical protein
MHRLGSLLLLALLAAAPRTASDSRAMPKGGHAVTAVAPPNTHRAVNVAVPRSTWVASARPSGVRGGFCSAPRLVSIPGVVQVWVYSPYVGTSVAVPALPAPDNPSYPACQSVADCGDGVLGHGAVCDKSVAIGADGSGLCREACRNDGDCDSASRCQVGVDPDGPDWAGCVPG